MKNKLIKNKRFLRIIPIMLLVMAMFCTLLSGCKKETGYRIIQVYQVEGDATVAREKVGNMDAYEKLNLLSGDWLSVFDKSYLRLKMDEDKYMLVEEESELSIYATSDEKNSRTDINLEKGAITVEVQNKLSDTESFEVTTPNAVMAVRGTVFNISARVDKNGNPVTKVAIFEGAVTVHKIDEQGNYTEETTIDSGKEVIIQTTEEGEVIISSPEDIDMEEFKAAVWSFLEDVVDGGRELCITKEEIVENKEEAEAKEAMEDTEIAEETETETETEIETESETETENESETETEKKTEALISTEAPTNTENSGNTGGDSSDGSTSGDSSSGGSSSTESTESTETPVKKTYTVTLMYGDMVFGTQQVEEGQIATSPKLAPAPSGRWDFDFSKPITADTTIYFIVE